MKSVLVVCTLLLAAPALAQMPNLIISEYVEGSSYNKALEIYNGTDEDISLVGYALEIYSNGSSSAVVIDLGAATISPQDVFVVANPSASSAILGTADLTSGSLSFNGDDALVLVQDGQTVDRFGQVGVDPGSAWSCADGATVNTTLRRQLGVCEGDTDPDAVFDPCTEYDFYPNDTFDGLGAHEDDCHSVGNGGKTWDALKADFR